MFCLACSVGWVGVNTILSFLKGVRGIWLFTGFVYGCHYSAIFYGTGLLFALGK